MNRQLALAALAAMSLLGCRQKVEEPAPPPPTVTTISEDARQSFLKAAPNAIIGTVTHVLTDSRLARVEQVDVKQFANGDTVLFSDGGKGQAIAAGQVVDVKTDGVHVQYAEPKGTERAPMVGDMAVKFANK